MGFDQMFRQGWELIEKIPEPWSSILKLLLLFAAASYLLYKTVRFVPQDKDMIKLRFGKVVFKDGQPVIYKAGLHIIMPFMHNLEPVDNRERVIRLKTDTHSSFYVSYKNGKPGGVKIPASITVIPIDVRAWRYVSEDVENRVTDIGVTELQGPITSADPDMILNNSAGFSEKLLHEYQAVINAKLKGYGGHLIAVNIGMADIPDSQPLADAVGSKDLQDVRISVNPRVA